MLGWDEIMEGGLAPNAMVVSWCGVKSGIEAARRAMKWCSIKCTIIEQLLVVLNEEALPFQEILQFV